MDDADVAIVVLSSTAGTAHYALEALRAQGVHAGLIKPRVFRPFPAIELCDALRNVKAVAVMDRSVSFGAMDNGGPLWLELLAAAQIQKLNIPIVEYVFGLGGREIRPSQIESFYHDLIAIAENGKFRQSVTYLGVRGDEQFQSAALRDISSATG
jgi:pyruvate ferredoxin oxidoreductase alpha subunit